MSDTDSESETGFNVAFTMTAILCTMTAILASLISIQTRSTKSTSSYLPNSITQPSKYAYEHFAWQYTPIWIFSFGCIVAFQLYESFTATSYNIVCVGLSLPFLLQPLVLPSCSIPFFSSNIISPDKNRPLTSRYAFKANLWIAIFSFIGNYWYTHYFYSVLKASYTFPAHRLNDVPIALYFATHFYFSSYHAFSNACLRKIETTFIPSSRRTFLFVYTILFLSYFTAFMETLTISSFPYYQFEDRTMAYIVGSAFYGIYFVFSFPMFYHFDNHVDDESSSNNGAGGVSVWRTIVDSCGCGMLVLCCLDFVRLWLGVPLMVGIGNNDEK